GLERLRAADALQGEKHLRPLGEGEEDLAALDLAPPRAAGEGFDSDHLSGREIENGLKERGKILARDRVVQQLAPLDLRAHRLARDLVARFPDTAVEEPLDAVLGAERD